MDPVLMFNACLRAEHAYYRLAEATVAFQKVWCTDGAVYTVLLSVNCITITDRGGWCGWHDVCSSNVWRSGRLEFLRVFADSLLMLKGCSCVLEAAVVAYLRGLCGKCVTMSWRGSLQHTLSVTNAIFHTQICSIFFKRLLQNTVCLKKKNWLTHLCAHALCKCVSTETHIHGLQRAIQRRRENKLSKINALVSTVLNNKHSQADKCTENRWRFSHVLWYGWNLVIGAKVWCKMVYNENSTQDVL